MIRWSWGYVPFLVIGTAFIANMVMVSAAHRVRPESVSDNPFLASRHFDADKAAEQRFIASGYDLTITTSPGEALLSVSGLSGQSAQLVAYRPDNASLDSVAVWTDLAANLRVP
jgi:nitrogen fixation protein FixH